MLSIETQDIPSYVQNGCKMQLKTNKQSINMQICVLLHLFSNNEVGSFKNSPLTIRLSVKSVGLLVSLLCVGNKNTVLCDKSQVNDSDLNKKVILVITTFVIVIISGQFE